MTTFLIAVGLGLLVVSLIGAFMLERRNRQAFPPPRALAEIYVESSWVRCMIRAEKEKSPGDGWANVRVQFSDRDGRMEKPLTFERESQDAMTAFEDRLRENGWQRMASGSSAQIPQAFEQVEHAVIFERLR